MSSSNHPLWLQSRLSPFFRSFALQDGSYDLSAPPPFGLTDIREAIPKHCWEKNAGRSMAYLALDVGIVAALAFGAYTLNAW